MTIRKQYVTWIGRLIGALILVWFFFAAYSDRLADGISRLIPVWFAILVLASWLVLIPLIPMLRGPLSVVGRVSLAIFVLISFLLYPVYAHFHPWATTVIITLCVLEGYWLILRRKTKVNRG